MSVAVERALLRLLWCSVHDQDTCSCIEDDQCDLCQATQALGLGCWTNSNEMERKLWVAEQKARQR